MLRLMKREYRHPNASTPISYCVRAITSAISSSKLLVGALVRAAEGGGVTHEELKIHPYGHVHLNSQRQFLISSQFCFIALKKSHPLISGK